MILEGDKNDLSSPFTQTGQRAKRMIMEKAIIFYSIHSGEIKFERSFLYG